MSRKISPGSQLRLDAAKKAGIDPELLISHYGLRFTLKLLNHADQSKNPKEESVSTLFPKPRVTKENYDRFYKQYENHLEIAGFTFHRWFDDFIDEDTGEVVSIERKKIYCIRL